MNSRRRLAAAANIVLERFGATLIGKPELNHLRAIEKKFVPVRGESFAAGILPEDAASYLRGDNPRLAQLRARYDSFDCPASCWSREYIAGIPLQWFRGDNPYVWQFQEFNSEMAHILTAQYIRTQDPMNLLDRLKEDGLFGAYTFSFNDEMLVSRDLLDSINEIMSLDRELAISQRPEATILDIGAGYGRLAYRVVDALPNVKRVFTTDAVPESTFLSEFYLAFRGVNDRAQVVPLDEIQDLMARQPIDLAVNIHSFSECTLSSIRWWLDLLVKHRVKNLLIVPNTGSHGGTKLLSMGSPKEPSADYSPALEERGYKRILMRPKYLATSVQKHGVSPTHYHFFELRG